MTSSANVGVFGGVNFYYAQNFLVVGDNLSAWGNNSVIIGSTNGDGIMASNSLIIGNDIGGYDNLTLTSSLLSGRLIRVAGDLQFAFGLGLINHDETLGGSANSSLPAIYLGQYNLARSGTNYPMLVVGNGSDSDHRSNALEIYRNGDINIPHGKLNFYGSASATTPAIVIDPDNAKMTISGRPVLSSESFAIIGVPVI